MMTQATATTIVDIDALASIGRGLGDSWRRSEALVMMHRERV